MNNVININDYTPLTHDKFFFDANIWLYLYCPMGNCRKTTIQNYDGFLKKVIQSKSRIFISSLILSEIFNRWLRLEFNMWKKHFSKYVDFKRDFRNTTKYKETVSLIKTTVLGKIIKIAKRIDDKFNNISLDELFEQIEKFDFNDNYFLAMANLEDFKIVTDDSDFAFPRKISVSILTANKKILKRL